MATATRTPELPKDRDLAARDESNVNEKGSIMPFNEQESKALTHREHREGMDGEEDSDLASISHDEAIERGYPGYSKEAYQGHFEFKLGSQKLLSRSFVGSKYTKQ